MKATAGWGETWMRIADVTALRSSCERAQCGAVVVTSENRIVATGYNGAPAGWHNRCGTSCPRQVSGPADQRSYDDCVSVHAEANALLFCDRRDREGGTIYCSTNPCWDCAKLIANSGLRKVVCRVDAPHRDWRRVAKFMRQCGITIIVWDDLAGGTTWLG